MTKGQLTCWPACAPTVTLASRAPVRPDHAPTLEGESNEHPGYMLLGKIYAVGYMQGLIEAAAQATD